MHDSDLQIIDRLQVPRHPRHVRLETGCLVGCLSFVALTVGVAAWNLANVMTTPAVSSVASIVWVLLVALVVWADRQRAGSWQEMAADHAANIAGDVLVQLERDANGRLWLRHGLVHGEHPPRLMERTVDVATITGISAVGGQAPGTFYLAVHYRRDPDAPRDAVELVGRADSREVVDSLAARITLMLSVNGVPDLEPTPDGWVRTGPERASGG